MEGQGAAPKLDPEGPCEFQNGLPLGSTIDFLFPAHSGVSPLFTGNRFFPGDFHAPAEADAFGQRNPPEAVDLIPF